MLFRQRQPAVPLSQFIECLWYLETCADPSSVQRVVPDGCMEIILHAGDPFSQIAEAQTKLQPRILLSGQLTRPILLAPSPNARVFGIRFRPCGASALFRVPLAELTNELIALDSLAPKLAKELTHALDYADPDLTLQHLEETLLRHIMNRIPRALTHAVATIRHGRGNVSLNHLAYDCNLTSRQLQRLFRDHVGLTAKTLCRIARFQHVLARLVHNSDRWADIAIDAGYYDQSHLLLDFRQFAGETPSFLLSPSTDLAEHFTSRHAMSLFSKTARA